MSDHPIQPQPAEVQFPVDKPTNHSNMAYVIGCMGLVIVFSLLGCVVLSGTIVWLLMAPNEEQIAGINDEDRSIPIAVESSTRVENTDGDKGNQPTSTDSSDSSHTTADRQLRPLESIEGVDVVRAGSKYRYDWKKIRKFQTDFKFETEMTKQRNISLRGSTKYTYSQLSAESLLGAKQADSLSTGTGFIVHPGGAILTCAHVVGSATEVEVLIGTEMVTGKVVATDQNLDLAIVRIPTSGDSHPHVSFAPRESIKQGARIRVLGFPLSDALGESIKVNSGAISGFGEGDTGRSIQIDATVNPGNSGGPVVDQSGRVIAIADAMLAGNGINPIGFAIPQEQAVKFLLENNVDVNVDGNVSGTASSDGESVARVKPSVVLLKVTGAGADNASVLNYESNWFIGSNYQTEEGKTVVDEHGNVLFTTGEGMMPLMSSPFAAIGIESLPLGDAKTWQDRQMMVLEKTEVTETPDRFGRLGYPYGGIYGGIYGSGQVREKTYQIPVVATSKHSLESTGDLSLSIKKSYRLEAASDDFEEKFSAMDMEGTYEFDTESGILKTGNFAGTTHVVSGDTRLIVPFKFSFTIGDSAVVEKAEQEMKERVAELTRKREQKEREIARIKSSKLDQFDPVK